MKAILSLIVVLLWAGIAQADPTTVYLQSRTFVPTPDPAFFSSPAPVHTRYLFVQLPEGSSPKDHLRDHGRLELHPSSRDARLAAAIEATDKFPQRFLNGRIGEWALRSDGRASLRVRFHDGVAVRVERRSGRYDSA